MHIYIYIRFIYYPTLFGTSPYPRPPYVWTGMTTATTTTRLYNNNSMYILPTDAADGMVNIIIIPCTKYQLNTNNNN